MGSHFGVGAPPILVYFSGDWEVHWGYRLLTHGRIGNQRTTPKSRGKWLVTYESGDSQGLSCLGPTEVTN